MKNIFKNANFELRLIGLLLFIFSLKAFQSCNTREVEQPARDWKAYNDSLLNIIEADATDSVHIAADSLSRFQKQY